MNLLSLRAFGCFNVLTLMSAVGSFLIIGSRITIKITVDLPLSAGKMTIDESFEL